MRSCRKSPILDVGTAQGYLGRMLLDSGLVIDGIEVDHAFAMEAKPYYRKLYEARVEEAKLEDRYGAIVCGDVLEHLVDPPGALRRLIEHLQPEGMMVVSLPNVAHLAVRLLLLSGRFPRMDRGILDRTHLHFFTRSSAEQLLEEAGLQILQRRATLVPLADILDLRWRAVAQAAEPVQRVWLRLLPEMFAYQWVFLTRPRREPQSVEDRPKLP